MNKQDYADKFSLSEWQAVCEEGDFIDAFWHDEFTVCDLIADRVLSGLDFSNR